MVNIAMIRPAQCLVAALAILSTALGGAQAARAANVTVEVEGINNDVGQVAIALCNDEHFLKRCAMTTTAPAARGAVAIVFTDVKPGRYAAQTFHDENQNGRLDTNAVGMPQEGTGFSNDATASFGPPLFSDAMFEVGYEDRKVRVRLAY